jgi:DNA-binding NarL/FixJ family response regulator
LTAAHHPDVILMDVRMKEIGGVEATKLILESYPDTKILMLTISEDEQDLFEALMSGARGYLLKNASTQELLAAIRQVHSGESPITPAMAAKLVNKFALQTSENDLRSGKSDGLDALTDREKEVLHLVARGFSNKEIGTKLSISPLTVKAHLSSILDKLHLRSRVEAAAWSIRHGMLRDRNE